MSPLLNLDHCELTGVWQKAPKNQKQYYNYIRFKHNFSLGNTAAKIL